jgi:YbbR domain-containing protein
MPLRSLFLDHLWLKLFSLLLATLIWLTIRANLNSPTRETTRRFARQPVVLMTESAEYRSFYVEPPQVNVTVRGPAALVEEMNDRDIHAFVQMAGEQTMAGMYPVEIHVPHGITVILVSPRTVLVRMGNPP